MKTCSLCSKPQTLIWLGGLPVCDEHYQMKLNEYRNIELKKKDETTSEGSNS